MSRTERPISFADMTATGQRGLGQLRQPEPEEIHVIHALFIPGRARPDTELYEDHTNAGV